MKDCNQHFGVLFVLKEKAQESSTRFSQKKKRNEKNLDAQKSMTIRIQGNQLISWQSTKSILFTFPVC